MRRRGICWPSSLARSAISKGHRARADFAALLGSGGQWHRMFHVKRAFRAVSSQKAGTAQSTDGTSGDSGARLRLVDAVERDSGLRILIMAPPCFT